MVEIRYAKPEDLQALTDIYNFYVENSMAVFDIKPQSLEQRSAWFKKYDIKGPYRLLVATENGQIIGCACTSRYRDHTAFDQTAEVSIYLSPEQRAKGIGTLPYQKLFEEVRDENIHLLVSGIALPNVGSVNLHKKFGFTEVGIFQEYAVKNGQYISSIWMQKIIEDK